MFNFWLLYYKNRLLIKRRSELTVAEAQLDLSTPPSFVLRVGEDATTTPMFRNPAEEEDSDSP